MTRASAGRACGALILGVLSVVFGQGEARAGFSVSLDSNSLNNTDTQFNYTAATTSLDRIVAGDHFTIHNFAGYVAGTITAPGNWSMSADTDASNPAETNLTFTFIGTSPVDGPATVVGFSAVSELSTTTKGYFDGSVTFTTGLADLTAPGSQLLVPGLGVVDPIPAPEPSGLILGGISALVCGLTYVRRRRAG